MRSDVFEEYSKNIFYWEMAYNIASYGKQWNFKNKDSNTWLEIRQQDSSWFIKNDGSEAPPFAINNIVFDYFDATGALQKAQTFNSSTNIELDYNSDNQTPWCFYNADMNTPLFRSFMCSNFAQF
jgi:hypothetical protein